MGFKLNGKRFTFCTDDLPLLINAKESFGGSRFAIELVAEFVHSGHNILFFSAFEAAKADLKDLLSNEEIDRSIIVTSGKETALIDAIKNLPDLTGRIVLIKNIEKYSHDLYKAIKDISNVVIAGDVSACSFKKELEEKKFNTIITFPVKYEGHASGSRFHGPIRLITNS